VSAPGHPLLVIFDCDGVLVDTERISATVGAASLTELGWELTEQDMIDRFLGCSDEHFRAEVVRELGPRLPPGWAEWLESRHLAALAGAPLVDGVLDVLELLDQLGVVTCVASNGSHAKMRRTLRPTGLMERFRNRVFSADDVAAGKPAPDLFLHAARSMGFAPTACVVVEDSPRGAQAARAAGMACVGYAALTTADQLAEQGAVICRTMPEVGHYLAGLAGLAGLGGAPVVGHCDRAHPGQAAAAIVSRGDSHG
jgi:HAD superfamily hydrolase (TIGR01509 family)